MRITFTGHAGLWVETDDVKILCDPWVSKNKAFFETWSVYPDNNNLDWDEIILNTDVLFLSHVHEDHFDEEFLNRLYLQNKKVKVLIPDFRFCVLKDKLKKIGFENFITKELSVGNTRAITYCSETIDREREDSSICINDGNLTFLNWNDSTLTPEHKIDIIDKFKKIDWATGQFSGATWWPTCYNYTEEKKKGFISEFKKRKVDHYKRMIEYLGVKKMIPTAGPACFLQKNMYHLNNFDDNQSVFFDSWDVSEFNDITEIYRVVTGDNFTYDTIQDRKSRPFDKKEYILENQYSVDYTLNDDKLKLIDEKIMPKFSSLLKNNGWLKRYIKSKVFIGVKNYKYFCLDFKKQTVEMVDEPIKKGLYYIINFEQKVIYELLTKNITDWENSAFLSCTCTFERNPDTFNPWIVSFFKNLENDRLQKIYEITQSSEVLEGKMIVGDYEINRYCPHQHYDLMHHGKVDLKNKTIECLGHGWKWDLQTCEGINCSAKIICNTIIRKKNIGETA